MDDKSSDDNDGDGHSGDPRYKRILSRTRHKIRSTTYDFKDKYDKTIETRRIDWKKKGKGYYVYKKYERYWTQNRALVIKQLSYSGPDKLLGLDRSILPPQMI